MTGDVADAAKDQLSKLGDTAKGIGRRRVPSRRKGLRSMSSAAIGAAVTIASLASAVERAAGEFDSPIPVAAQYLRQTAQQIESVAGGVENRSIKEMVADTEAIRTPSARVVLRRAPCCSALPRCVPEERA